MISAELDANGWAVVIAAIFLGCQQIVSMVLSHFREQRNLEKLAYVGKQVEEVHLATNGMKHELVEEVRKSSFARGAKSEVDKHGAEPTATAAPAALAPAGGTIRAAIHESAKKVEETVRETAEDVKKTIQEER